MEKQNIEDNKQSKEQYSSDTFKYNKCYYANSTYNLIKKTR